MSRADCLDKCDAALADKPRLSAVFDPAWRADFRTRALAEPEDPAFGYPPAYWWPMLERDWPPCFPPEIQRGVEVGLDVLWPKSPTGIDGKLPSGYVHTMASPDAMNYWRLRHSRRSSGVTR